MAQLEEIFGLYGYDQPVHQQSLIDIFYLSGIFESDFFAYTLDYLQAYQDSKEDVNELVSTIERFNCATSQQNLDLCETRQLLLDLNFKNIHNFHDWLVKATQQKIFARRGERWEVIVPSWIRENEDELLQKVAELGLLNETAPKENVYDAAAVFGSTGPEMQKRIDYLKSKLENQEVEIKNSIYLLSGERYIKTDNIGLKRDGGKEYLTNLAVNLNTDVSLITEADIMLDIATQSLQDITSKNPIAIKLINSKDPSSYNPEIKRPDTRTTLIDFASQVDEKDKTILFISRGAHVLSQGEVTRSVLSRYKPELDFEVVGSGYTAQGEKDISKLLHYVLMALASSFYFGYERVAVALNHLESDEKNQLFVFDHIKHLMYDTNFQIGFTAVHAKAREEL